MPLTINDFITIATFVAAASTIALIVFWKSRKEKQHSNKIEQYQRNFQVPFFLMKKFSVFLPDIIYVLLFFDKKLVFANIETLPTEIDENSIEKSLSSNKKNFEIPYSEITKIKLRESGFGLAAEPRSGQLIVESNKYHGKFDLDPEKDFEEYEGICRQFLNDKMAKT